MSREENQHCPVPGCPRKNVKRLSQHLLHSHPGVDPAAIMPVDTKPGYQSAVVTGETLDDFQNVAEHKPEDPPESVDYGHVISQLIHANDLLMQQLSEQQQRLEDVARNQTQFQESVITEMNKIPDVARRVVTGTLDQIMAEAQAKAGGDGAGALVEAPAPSQPSGNRSAMLEQLLPLVLQKILGGDNSGQTDLVKQITSLQAIANAFNQPMLTGMQMATTMFTAAARAGLKPEEAATGAQALIDNMTQKKPGT